MITALLSLVLFSPNAQSANEKLSLLQSLTIQRMREGYLPSVFLLQGRQETFRAERIRPVKCYDLPDPMPPSLELPNAIDWFSSDPNTTLEQARHFLNNLDEILRAEPLFQLQSFTFVTFSVGNVLALRGPLLSEVDLTGLFDLHMKFAKEIARKQFLAPEDLVFRYDDVAYVLSILESLLQNSALRKRDQEWVVQVLMEISTPLLARHTVWLKKKNEFHAVMQSMGLTNERLLWSGLLLRNARIRAIGSVSASHQMLIDEFTEFEALINASVPAQRRLMSDLYYRTLLQFLIGALNAETLPKSAVIALPMKVRESVLRFLRYLDHQLIFLRKEGFVPSPALANEVSELSRILLQRPEAHRLHDVRAILIGLRGDNGETASNVH